MTTVPISYKGLTEAEVIRALYHGTRPLGVGVFYDKRDFTVEDAQSVVEHAQGFYPDKKLRFDYVSGRPLKVTVDTVAQSIIHPGLYDRDAGEGACARVIAAALAAKAVRA